MTRMEEAVLLLLALIGCDNLYPYSTSIGQASAEELQPTDTLGGSKLQGAPISLDSAHLEFIASLPMEVPTGEAGTASFNILGSDADVLTVQNETGRDLTITLSLAGEGFGFIVDGPDSSSITTLDLPAYEWRSQIVEFTPVVPAERQMGASPQIGYLTISVADESGREIFSGEAVLDAMVMDMRGPDMTHSEKPQPSEPSGEEPAQPSS